MRNIFIPKSTFLLLCFCSSFSQLNAGNDDGGEFVMQSPSKQLAVCVSVDDNHLSYRALHLRQTILEYSAKKGVKIWLWKAYPDRKGIDGLQTVERRRSVFPKTCGRFKKHVKTFS